MFITEHLEGRLLYETDKVVCINVYIRTNTNYAATQILYSLVNGTYFYIPSDINLNVTDGISILYISIKDFNKEIEEGIQKYIDVRRRLKLPTP